MSVELEMKFSIDNPQDFEAKILTIGNELITELDLNCADLVAGIGYPDLLIDTNR